MPSLKAVIAALPVFVFTLSSSSSSGSVLPPLLDPELPDEEGPELPEDPVPCTEDPEVPLVGVGVAGAGVGLGLYPSGFTISRTVSYFL